MPDPKNQIHVAVIGGGPGGYAAAFKAADLGMRVTLIDQEPNPGGVCLYRGCIPSKALLHLAKVINDARQVRECGIDFGEPKLHMQKVQSWKDKVVQQLTGGLGKLRNARKINFIQGKAQFVTSHNLKIEKSNSAVEEVKMDYSIIATGSSPTQIPSLTLDSPFVLDSTGALNLNQIPQSMLVIGGGYIGLEMATVYQAFGTKVTIAEMTPTLLPGVDPDLVTILEKQLKSLAIDIRLNTRVAKMVEENSGIKVSFEIEKNDIQNRTFETVLVAIGRRPNVADIGIENTSVKCTSQGFIQVDHQRRTVDPSIFAIGDVAGEPMLAHKATHEGIVAAEVINGGKSTFSPNAIPAVVFTDPEIAWCGLTESQAKEKNLDIQISRYPWSASGRAGTLGNSVGLTKLIIDKESERILGVGICGTNAGDLIAEGALSIEMAAVATDLKLTIHPHPTLSETIMESAELFYGPSTHLFRPPKRS